jgi:PAS domain S-box-containing protein
MLTLSIIQHLHETMPVPCLILQSDLRIVGANEAYLLETGLNKAVLIDHLFFEVIQTEENARQNLITSFEKVIQNKVPHEIKLFPFNFPANNQTIPCRHWGIKNVPVIVDNSDQVYILHYAEKINTAAAAVTTSNTTDAVHDYGILVNSIQDYAIFLMDKRGIIKSWNKGAEIIKGYTAAEAIGQSIEMFYVEEDPEKEIGCRNLAKALKYGGLESEGWQKRKDGSTFYAHIKLTPLVDERGIHTGFSQITREITGRINNETQINFLSDITRNILDPIIATDNQFNITRWNKAAEQMFEWSREDALGKHTIEVLRAQFTEDELASVLKTLESKGYWQGEVNYLNKSGKYLNGLCSFSHLKDAHDKVYGNLILIKDITLRKQAEQALSELNKELERRVEERTNKVISTEKKYQSLFDNNPMPMWVIRQEDFIFMAVNHMATLQYGYSREEFLSMTALDIRPEEEKTTFLLSDHSFTTTPENFHKGLWKHRKKDGTVIYVEIIGHDILFENTPAKMILAHDITERITAAETLAAREIFFRSIIENSAEGISLVDANYQNIYRSPAALKIAGNFNSDNLMGKVHPEDKAVIEEKTVQLFQNEGVPIPFLGRFKNGADAYIWLEGTFTNLLNIEGVKAIVTNFRDVSDRMIAVENLAASEKLFRDKLDNMMEGVSIIGFDWTYQYVNDTLVKTTKFKRKELLGWTIMDRYPGIETTPLFKVLKRVMKTRIAQQVEHMLTSADGSISFLQLSIQPVPEGIFVLSIDITERKNGEIEIKKSQDLVRTILDRISDSFVVIDVNWNYVYVNKATGVLLNRTPEELIGKNMMVEYPELAGHNLEKYFIKAMETQQHNNVEEYYAPLDLWLQTDIYPSPEGLSLFFADITPRKKTEQHLLQSQEYLRAIFDNSSEGFILADREGIIKVFNNNITDSILPGVSDQVKEGETILKIVEPERQEFFRQVLKDVLKGKTIQYDRKYIKKNGHATWINLVINPVYKNAVVEGVCITGRDVTDKKNAEEKLKKTFAENLALSDRLSTIINTLPASIALLDSNGDIMEVNKNWKVFETNNFQGRDFCIGCNYVNAAGKIKGKKSEDKVNIANGVSDVLHGNLDEFVYEYSSEEKDQEKWYRLVVTPLKKNEDSGVVIMYTDISELHRLEAERLRQQVEQQKKITKAILQGQEKERNHIGRELHDNINQILAGTRLYLSMAGSKDELVKESVKYPLELLDESIKEIRVLCSNMVTPLQDVHLEDLVRGLLGKLAKYKIYFRFEYNVPAGLLSDELKLNLYRIIQELSQNVIKYAMANLMTVEIWTDNDCLNMIVTDNGKGFDTDAKRQGIGISNMHSRVRSFNGKIKIESTEGQGTKTTIIVPYNENSHCYLN